MTTEPEPAAVGSEPDLPSPTLEERLRQRVSMLTQLLIVAAIVVVLQFVIMLKMLIETSK
jgi:hypothetical protein